MDIESCITCGNAFPIDDELPDVCPLCADDRQYLPDDGQQWVRSSDLAGRYTATFSEAEPGMTRLEITPRFGIGHRPTVIDSGQGNLLWEPSGFVDDDLLQQVADRGGVAAVAASHPHLVGAAVVWAAEFDAPLYFAADDHRWLTHPDRRIELWHDQREILPGLTLVQAGGHFAGSAVLHWVAGADGRGVLLSGDTVMATPGHTASFLRSYPNMIPLSERLVSRIVDRLAPYRYDRLYDAFAGTIGQDAQRIIAESAERYIGWLTDRIRDPDEATLTVSRVP